MESLRQVLNKILAGFLIPLDQVLGRVLGKPFGPPWIKIWVILGSPPARASGIIGVGISGHCEDCRLSSTTTDAMAEAESPTEVLLRFQRSGPGVLDFLGKQRGEHLHHAFWRAAIHDVSDFVGEAYGAQLLQ